MLLLFLKSAIIITIFLLLLYPTQCIEKKEYSPQKEILQEKDIALPEEYVENVIVIDEQPMYYKYPLHTTPKLIIYSHGEFQHITTSLEEPYMIKMQEYGDFFTSQNFAFSASNQHDDNYGGKDALRDIYNSILWFEENNLTLDSPKYLIGFSMGGKSAINYAIENPDDIKKIALLAPSPKEDLTKEDVEKLRNIDIKIWHGNRDENIAISTSEEYSQNFRKYGKEVELITIEEVDHFEIETFVMKEILEFFQD